METCNVSGRRNGKAYQKDRLPVRKPLRVGSRRKGSREVAILAASKARLARKTRLACLERQKLRPWLDKVTPGNCLTVLRKLPDECIDLLATDPPYGSGYKVARARCWDDNLPPIRVWKQCYRVLKPGAFAFVMSSARQDLYAKMITNLNKAGFCVEFPSLWYAYETGFPRAANIGCAIDRKLGVRPQVVNVRKQDGAKFRAVEQTLHNGGYNDPHRKAYRVTAPVSAEAKFFAKARGGFQPRPMLEAVIVAMKPLSENSFYAQALKNAKGVTYLGDCFIPSDDYPRFPGNLLTSGFEAFDAEWIESQRSSRTNSGRQRANSHSRNHTSRKVEGIFPKCTNLDAWFREKLKQLPLSAQRTFPFLFVPKPSQREKNRGLAHMPYVTMSGLPLRDGSGKYFKNAYGDGSWSTRYTRTKNYHCTVKPLRLFCYLLTLGSRRNDVVLDPYFGSGTTGGACQMLKRHFIGIEIDKGYCKIARARLAVIPNYLSRSRKWTLRSKKYAITRVVHSARGNRSIRSSQTSKKRVVVCRLPGGL